VPTLHKCNNPECQKTFLYPAKKAFTPEPIGLNAKYDLLEIPVCPFCNSIDFQEAPPQPTQQQQVEAVYIYELTTGSQDKLNQLLADGFQIVNRFSKQYHLEKPKTQTTEEAV
jgi:hypothetical protein